MRFGGAPRPSSARVKGTMYRGGSSPRPTPRRCGARLLFHKHKRPRQQNAGLPGEMLADLDRLILPQNARMRAAQRLAKTRARTSDGAVVLEWHEGVNEVAGVVDFDP